MTMQNMMTAQLHDAVRLAVAFAEDLPEHLERAVVPLVSEDRQEHLSMLIKALREGRLVEKGTRDLLREANIALDEVVAAGALQVELSTEDVIWLAEPRRLYETRYSDLAKAAMEAKKPLLALFGQVQIALNLRGGLTATQELLER